LLSTAAGLIAAAVVYFLHYSLYESQAKLLVRYVMDKSVVDSIDSQVEKMSSSTSENTINSEVEILTSWDLAAQVVEKFTVNRLFPGNKEIMTSDQAASVVLKNLKVTASKTSNVITVFYTDRDPKLARSVLEEIVHLYFEKHLEVHRSAGAFEFVTKETELIRSRLQQTEGEARELKSKAGIISLAKSIANIDEELAKCERELLAVASERAEQTARITEMQKTLQGVARERKPAKVWERGIGDEANVGVQKYQTLAARVVQLRQAGLELLAKYTPENRLVKLNGLQLEELQREMRALELKHPGIAAVVSVTGAPQDGPVINLGFEQARLAGINARAETLQAQFQALQERAGRLLEMEPAIAALDRRKEVQEANYKYFEASLEKSRIDEALDPSKIPNISVVQKPTPASRSLSNLAKVILAIAGGGSALGIASAMLIELLVDQTVKRPLELETRLRIPLLLSIPYFGENARTSALRPALELLTESGRGSSLTIAAWEIGHDLRPFAEAIRDRLVLYFEMNGIHRRPKLVAVTGCSAGAGASTLASVLAATFSDTGDGKVLLVDLNGGDPEMHPFFRGMPVSSLVEVLEPGVRAEYSGGNLYLATGSSDGAAQLIPRKFYDLIPRLKASDFDYIIFDMPPMGETSTTLAIAGFMDRVLLVVEAEINERIAVKRAYAELLGAKANVACVFNKVRSYTPKWAQGGS
jgi:uncharacterized protein involved in exopolysaccharide biosynthesis/Mrp family chromosome partitioning ATPase